MRTLLATTFAACIGALAPTLSANAECESALHPMFARARILADAADADDDGLADATEEAIGSDPAAPDTDGDGLLDGDEEILLSTGALVADSDGDGFGDGLELAAGADPLSVASAPVSVSGAITADEVLAAFGAAVIARLSVEEAAPAGARARAAAALVATNAAAQFVVRDFSATTLPAAFSFDNAVATGDAFDISAWLDIDGDGERADWEPAGDFRATAPATPAAGDLDGIEIVLSFDVDADTDANGLPDFWEWERFGAIGNDPRADPDGDGLDNLAEFEWGTDPLDDDSDADAMTDGNEAAFGFDPTVADMPPQPTLERAANGKFRLGWDTRYSQGYMPQFTDRLSPPAWSNLVPHTLYEYQSHPYGSMSVIDMNTNSPMRFYRIKLEK